MKLFKNKLHLLLLPLILLFLVIGIFRNEEKLDINIHDTYFVITYDYLMIFSALFILCLLVIYWGMMRLKFRFSSWMNLLSILTLYIGFILILIPNLFLGFFTSDNSYESSFPLFSDLAEINIVITIGAIVFALSQVFFGFSFLVAVFRKIKDLIKARL
ncbi:hypothetical protein [Aureivirga sp. CE67]|uniref:hypothetical protein n=1 Tax=Aureivirga sp. CE67 TaxID=1788983 RepID=UPI0018CAF981|nr:hypothetical protein [Aureivirga sp. CE67]